MDVTKCENGARTARGEGFPNRYTAHFGGLVLRGAATDGAGKRRGGWPIRRRVQRWRRGSPKRGSGPANGAEAEDRCGDSKVETSL